MSTTRSCSILCELYQQAVVGAEEQLADLVECILTSVRAEHIESGNASLSDHMLEILMTCVEECNPLPPRVLEAILVSLLPSARKENPPSCYLAKKLLGRCSEPLSDPVSDCLNALLTGSSSSCDERFLCSELSEHVMAVRGACVPAVGASGSSFVLVAFAVDVAVVVTGIMSRRGLALRPAEEPRGKTRARVGCVGLLLDSGARRPIGPHRARAEACAHHPHSVAATRNALARSCLCPPFRWPSPPCGLLGYSAG